MPSRPYKSKAEAGVQIIERWILALLRHQIFFSLAELNHCISALLVEVNHKPFKQLKGNRQQWFESLDKPVLRPLPKQRDQYTDIKTVKININYHVQYDQHLYLVPHHLVSKQLQLHAKDMFIQLYFHNKRLASHLWKYQPSTTTVAEHMPVKYEKHHQWNASRLMNWEKEIGDDVLV